MDPIITGFLLIMDPFNLFLIFIAVVLGVLVGALPGLSSTMAVALLLPFTITLDPIPAIAMMSALYCAGTFGCSITAILIYTPGAPPAVPPALAGYPLAPRGGAGRPHNPLQFLTEAVVRSTVGGLIGIGLGYAICGVASLHPKMVEVNVTIWSVALALGFSAGTGIFFGIVPAFKAAILHPIDALRHE